MYGPWHTPDTITTIISIRVILISSLEMIVRTLESLAKWCRKYFVERCISNISKMFKTRTNMTGAIAKRQQSTQLETCRNSLFSPRFVMIIAGNSFCTHGSQWNSTLYRNMQTTWYSVAMAMIDIMIIRARTTVHSVVARSGWQMAMYRSTVNITVSHTDAKRKMLMKMFP